MTGDPRLGAPIHPIPDELRPHLAGLAAAEHCPTHGPASVFRLAGGRARDAYLKVLGERDAGTGSLQEEAARLEWYIVAGIWSFRHNFGKGSVGALLDGYGLQALDREKLSAYWRWWDAS